jgi:hypothetical protein
VACQPGPAALALDQSGHRQCPQVPAHRYGGNAEVLGQGRDPYLGPVLQGLQYQRAARLATEHDASAPLQYCGP